MFRKGEMTDSELTLVYNASNPVEAGMVKSLLEEHGIPVMIMDREDSGQYLRILGYGSPFGMDVYVGNEHAEQAAHIVGEMLSQTELSDDELEKIALEAGEPEEE